MPRTAQTAANQRKRKETLRPHKTRDAILDAMAAYGQPISPTRLSEVTGASLGSAAYHVRTLLSAGVLREAGEERVRGAVEHFYELAENHELVAAEQRLLQLAGAMTVSTNGGYPAVTVLDDEAREELAKELRLVVPRVRKIAKDAHKRAATSERLDS
jgi:hypothetical protein